MSEILGPGFFIFFQDDFTPTRQVRQAEDLYQFPWEIIEECEEIKPPLIKKQLVKKIKTAKGKCRKAIIMLLESL